MQLEQQEGEVQGGGGQAEGVGCTIFLGEWQVWRDKVRNYSSSGKKGVAGEGEHIVLPGVRE